MSQTEQTTFGNVTVKKHKAGHMCDNMRLDDETGEMVRCTNTAKVEINRKGEPSNKYCKVHAQALWLEMANIE